jgi:hypothetical protein
MRATTMKKLLRVVGAVGLLAIAGCDDTTSVTGGPDMAMTGGNPDMGPAFQCVMDPKSGADFLNACTDTTVQTGDPNKDAPYYPSLAPNGQLQPLP